MAEIAKIEWRNHTFNPWMGCTRVSPGCDNCYAEAREGKRLKRVNWGAGEPRRRTAESTWAQPRRWNRQAQIGGSRPFVFCSSLADVSDNEVDPRWREDLFRLIAATPNLVWLLLTKRIGNVPSMVNGALPGNVAIGATMVNQVEYDRDNPKLARVKEALNPLFTFASLEPLLGPVELDNDAPDWIIVGGESGPRARPMDLDWARSLQEQTASLARIFNFKQVGGRGSNKGGHELDGMVYFDRPAVPANANTIASAI